MSITINGERQGIEILNKETGECELYPIPQSFDDIDKFINSVMMDRLKAHEAMALLAAMKSGLYRRKLAVQDGVYNAYLDKLDFSEESKFWKSTFDSKKIRDQLHIENTEYAAQVSELNIIQELTRCVDVLIDFVKMVDRSSWGRASQRED